MSSRRESIGVLREVPCIKSIPLSVLDHRKVPDIFLNQTKHVEEYLPGLINDTVKMILGKRKKIDKKPSMTMKKLECQMNQFFKNMVLNVAVVENSSISKMLALVCLAVSRRYNKV
jgi:hypothetical protein